AELDAVLGENHQRPDWTGREPFLHARHNIFESNEIHNVMEAIGDGNAIYVSGCGTGNVIRRNWCHDNFGEYMNAVIRNDDDQHGTVFEGNLLARSGGHGEGIINKGANIMRHNLVADLRPIHRHRAYLVLVHYAQTGAVHRGNVYYARRPDQTAVFEHPSGRPQAPPPRLADVDSDGNLYFCTADPEWGGAVLARFQPQGVEAASLATDPLFVDPDRDDYQFRPESPALALGIPQPVAVAECGLEPAYRARWLLPRLRTRIEPNHGAVTKELRVTITADDPQAAIHYTTDGSEPTEHSPRYTQPLALAADHVVRARAFAPGKMDLTGAYAWFEPPPRPVREDFEALAVGGMVPGATTTEEAPFTARVSDEQAASGTRSLKFVDGPEQKHAFNPHVFYRQTFPSGPLVGRFALRVSPESEFYYQWRQYEGGAFARGPGVRVNPGGRLVHEDRELMTLPTDAWVKIEVAAELGEGRGRTFVLKVELPDGTLRTFPGLPCEAGFDRLDWVGFVAVANHACVTYVDDILVAPAE
ncbi:MAG: chitobiase/beta-hexosaminidase C-terminal domain-containing protein, partial [Lentisphaeria bacterium]|nr:chitobiase/beta-hexosaminidase C-terminal domain-containing protein [Lentisphaeria bacterium]